MPRLWDATIGEHRSAVSDAILDAAGALAQKHGLRGVTMSQIAQETGIGRATLYKYFPDIRVLLLAWHERQLTDQLHQLKRAKEGAASPWEALQRVLRAYARLLHQHSNTGLEAFHNRLPHGKETEQRLMTFVGDLVAAAAREGQVRADCSPAELAAYLLAALSAAQAARSAAAVERLVGLVLDALRPAGAVI